MFLDRVKIKIQAGNGGDGAVSVLWLLQLVAIMDKHSADKIIICLILIVLSF